MKICVYCASSAAADDSDFLATERLAREILRENFMHPRHLDMWTFVDEPEAVIPALRTAASRSQDAIGFAVNRGSTPAR